MTISLKLWRSALDAVFGPIERYADKCRRKESFKRIVICGDGRDAFRYYEKGSYVVIEAELMCGGLDRLINRSCLLKWDDSGKLLSEEDTEQVFRNLCEYLNQKKVRWKFSAAGS